MKDVYSQKQILQKIFILEEASIKSTLELENMYPNCSVVQTGNGLSLNTLQFLEQKLSPILGRTYNIKSLIQCNPNH